ncbi:MAG TPA: hypothetical protein VMX75_05150 [Spirochaetia bacterium]|nr:hypothetical protein [Spirochaetia bacterium]
MRNVMRRIVPLLFILAAPVCFAQNEVVGIVSRIKGELVHEAGATERKLHKLDFISRGSILRLAEGQSSGWIEILTSTGPIRFSRFPVSGFLQFAGLSANMQKQYRTALGGKTIGTRGAIITRGVMENIELFEWEMDPGSLDERDIKEGLALVLSRTESSRKSGVLSPLSFRLFDGITIAEARFVILQRGTGTIEKEGELEKRGDDWIFHFDCFDYRTNTVYQARCLLTLEEGIEVPWDFSFRIFNEADMLDVKDEARRALTREENEFQEAMVRAALLRSYQLKISALQVLAHQGVDIGELFD